MRNIEPNVSAQNQRKRIANPFYRRNEEIPAKSCFAIFLIVATEKAFLIAMKPESHNETKQIETEQIAVQPDRNPKKGMRNSVIGMVLFLGGSTTLILIQYGSIFNLPRPDRPFLLYGVALTAIALGIRLIVRGKKLRTRDVEDVIREKENCPDNERPNFLYLRSFFLDEADAQQRIPMPGGLSAPINPWESGLASAFGKVGDLVAIGRPGEKLATTGAARLYVTEDEWQDRVLELIGKSEIVVWTYGESDGLLWEISQLEKRVSPEKLILAFPFWNLKMKTRQSLWKEAKQKLETIFPKPLPNTIGKSLFIGFDKDWNAQWIETRPPSLWLRIACLGFWNPVVKGVESLLKERGFDYPPLTTGERVFIGIFAAMGWVVVGTLLVMIYGLFVAFR